MLLNMKIKGQSGSSEGQHNIVCLQICSPFKVRFRCKPYKASYNWILDVKVKSFSAANCLCCLFKSGGLKLKINWLKGILLFQL